RVRQRYAPEAVLVGLTTYTGTVTAGSDWDGPAERKRVRPALEDSYEASFHYADMPKFLLPVRDSDSASIALREPKLERAIGVIYLPQTERQSHYFEARLSIKFDDVIYLDETRSLQPLARNDLWYTG